MPNCPQKALDNIMDMTMFLVGTLHKYKGQKLCDLLDGLCDSPRIAQRISRMIEQASNLWSQLSSAPQRGDHTAPFHGQASTSSPSLAILDIYLQTFRGKYMDVLAIAKRRDLISFGLCRILIS